MVLFSSSHTLYLGTVLSLREWKLPPSQRQKYCLCFRFNCPLSFSVTVNTFSSTLKSWACFSFQNRSSWKEGTIIYVLPQCHHGVSKLSEECRAFYKSVGTLWATKELNQMGTVSFKRTFPRHTKSLKTDEGHKGFRFLSCRKLITRYSFGIGITMLYAQSRVCHRLWHWRRRPHREVMVTTKKPHGCVGACCDVTVSFGEGFIWLHLPFDGRIKSSIRSFCRTWSI